MLIYFNTVFLKSFRRRKISGSSVKNIPKNLLNRSGMLLFSFFSRGRKKGQVYHLKITGIFITFAKGKISANNWNWLVIKFPNKNSNAKLNRMNSVQSAPWYNVIISYASDKHGSYQSNQGNEELKKKKGNNHFKNLKMKLNWFLE